MKILLTRERFYTGGFILSWLLASISNLNAVYETNFLKESGYEILVDLSYSIDINFCSLYLKKKKWQSVFPAWPKKPKAKAYKKKV